MEKTLEQLQVEFVETFGKEAPNNKKNDAEWIASKIAEAQKVEEENQTANPDENSGGSKEDEFKEDENRFNTEENQESDDVVDNEDYDDNSVDNQLMTQEARKVGNIVYPV